MNTKKTSVKVGECWRCGFTRQDTREYGGGCDAGWGAHFKRHDYRKANESLTHHNSPDPWGYSLTTTK